MLRKILLPISLVSSVAGFVVTDIYNLTDSHSMFALLTLLSVASLIIPSVINYLDGE